ncbi:MAG: endonuclease domain-containing protein [Chloroflexota bacterium]
MPIENIIPGQKISPEKLQLARQLRQEMTPAERKLWQALRGNRLGGFHFRRQQIIAGFIIDFYCHAAGLVIELDGDVHSQQEEYDTERDATLVAMGLRVVRIRDERVETDFNKVVQEILAACRHGKKAG